MYRKVEIKVPATTANLGPGFDCLGMALDLWNTIELELDSDGIEITGEGADTLSRNENNLIYESAINLFQTALVPIPRFSLTCHNNIPLERGLGSSAAAVIGGLSAANEICGKPLDNKQLARLACTIEGHPDNVMPALEGGLRIVIDQGENILSSSVTIPANLKAVALIPHQTISTKQARTILPSNISRDDAIFNLGRVALLVNSLSSGNTDYLQIATQDRLHQPQREILFPSMRLIFQAAKKAGALGVFLSGSGPTIIALTEQRGMTIAYEMADIAEKSGVYSDLRIMGINKTGVTSNLWA
jgi:homoserine kinase